MTTIYKHKQPGGADRRYRVEARVQDKKAQKSDINPQLRSLQALIFALRDEIKNFILNAAQNPGSAAPTFWMNNGSPDTLSAGDVVVVDAVTARSVTTTNTANDPRPAAVVVSAGPVAIGADVELRFLGMAAPYVDADIAAVAKGDALTTSTTIRHLQKATSQSGNIVGIASEDLAAGQDTILVFMLPSFQREGFVLELLTADNAGQVTLTHEPYSDSDGPHVIIYDLANYKISFAAEWATGQWGGTSPDRACLSAAGNVVTNALADFDTGANQLYAYYLRADCYTIADGTTFSAFLKSEIFMLSLAETGYFDVKFTALKTIEQSLLDALTELAVDMGVRMRKEFHYDINERLCSTHWYWSASSIITARHGIFYYSGDYLLTYAYSQMSTDATHKYGVPKALEYVGGLLSKIIPEVSP